jgi:hypothetical protein
MGSALRKPVAVNNWESLTSEAKRLQASATDLIRKAHGETMIRSLEDRLRIIKSQTLMIRLMLVSQSKENESRQEWINTWWDSMDNLFAEFQTIRSHALTPISELEERLLV